MHDTSPASPWVSRFIGGVTAAGHILDVACGSGRHVALARSHDLTSTGVDRDIAAARLAFAADSGVHLLQRDLEDGNPFPFESASFDGVIVTNYLWRPLLPAVVAAVAPDGVLIYETFRIGNERFGKPSNPQFLLRPGELLEAVSGKLHVVAYEDISLASPWRPPQRICAVGSRHRWIAAPPIL